MLTRLIVAALLAVIAALVAASLSRRNRPSPEVAPDGWNVPSLLHRQDFAQPDSPWLVAVFSSATCEVCASVWERTQIVASAEVAVQNLEATADKRLHERYQIDAVPLVVIADDTGTVRKHFLGPVNAADLWGALAELRDAEDGED